MSSLDPLAELLLVHRDDSEIADERRGAVWVSCSCFRTELWGGDNPWPVTPIPRSEAERLHAQHVAATIREGGFLR